ncbi:MAG: MobA/MobL family protein [Eubacterium sp.]|nr:MobA/MobL family protein [Eubacterium sp.]
MKRNSFIEMAKLHDLSGRITYISSHAKQEHLYEVYATEPDRAFWRELAKCNQEEFGKSGTNGKCIEARELMVALPESFINYDHDYLLKKMVDEFKEKYGVECHAALHHNKRKTNLHIHMIFAERKRLEQPTEKVATRNMFYDEQGHHVRTKKEILDEDGNIRKGCKIIKKGEVYERKIFTVKDERFKQESFLDEIKVFYTDLINQMALDDKDRLSIFDKNGLHLATKKVGKNNPKAEEIKADNEIRMEWNRAVDRAIVSGVADAEIIELKKTEITEKVKESVEQNGKKPELFGEIVRAALLLLELLIAKAMQKVMDIAEKAIGIDVGAANEISKETDSRIHAGDNPTFQPERKKIPFPVNPHREVDRKKNTEYPAADFTEKESIIKQIKAEQKPVLIEKEQTAERPPQPKPSVLVRKYPRLKEIEDRLKEQNKAIFGRKKKRDKLKKELSECTGIFKGGRRKELQQEIDSLDFQISNMKKRLSSIVKEYNFDSIQAFCKEFNVAKRENQDYELACAEYEKIYGEKVVDTRSVRERIRQKEQIVKDREAGRVHQARQKDTGAR